VTVQCLSLFIPVSKGTPETLITCTCKQQWAPPTNLPVDHTLVPTVPLLRPPYCYCKYTESPTNVQCVHRHEGRRSAGGRGGSTHIQRVLVDDDEGHAVCHQTTGVTWEAGTDSGRQRIGGGREIRFAQTQNTAEKLVSCWRESCLTHSYLTPPQSISLWCSVMHTSLI